VKAKAAAATKLLEDAAASSATKLPPAPVTADKK
jgi:hypothetical protein